MVLYLKVARWSPILVSNGPIFHLLWVRRLIYGFFGWHRRPDPLSTSTTFSFHHHFLAAVV